MTVSRMEESDNVYYKMEELGCRAVEEVASEVAKINHAITAKEARAIKIKAFDNFVQMVDREFTLSSEQEVVQLLKKPFEFKIYGSPLLNQEINRLKSS